MSDDTINRKEAINAVLRNLNKEEYRGSWESGAVKEVEQTLEQLPSASTIEPQRGEWIYDMNQYYKCTNCGHLTLMPDSGSVFIPDWDEYHFCPNCGADMREREGE